MSDAIRKAVFPAAGLGTRFLPATKAQPKEMLPLVDKPIIQYGVEEAVAYSFGKGALARWLERWLLDPLLGALVRRKSGRALRCLAERLGRGAGAEPGAEPGATPDPGRM